jgi:hypothetical protein
VESNPEEKNKDHSPFRQEKATRPANFAETGETFAGDEKNTRRGLTPTDKEGRK